VLRVVEAAPDQILQVRDTWDDLVDRMKRPSPFCTWEWIHTWLKHFGGRYSPLILFVYDGPRLAGILPLARRFMHLEDSFSFARAITYCSSLELHSDHLDIIADACEATSCANACVEFFSNSFRNWDVISFSHLSEDADLLRVLRDGACPFTQEVSPVDYDAFIPLETSFHGCYDEWLTSLKGKRRHELRRTRRHLERAAVSYTGSTTESSAADLKDLFKLHGMRAERKGLKTNFQGEDLYRFHCDVARLFAEKGNLWLRFLRNGDTPIAALYSFALGRRVFAYQTGLDPEWEPKGAGAVLFMKMIEESFASDMSEFDFLRGGTSFKGSLTSDSRTLYDLRLYNRTIAGVASRHLRWVRTELKQVFKKARENGTAQESRIPQEPDE
jgi:Acetyltransferase (GNAT) domain